MQSFDDANPPPCAGPPAFPDKLYGGFIGLGNDGKILLCGGNGEADIRDECHYWNQEDGTWANDGVPNLPGKRALGATAQLSDGRLWLLGGVDNHGDDLDSTLFYDQGVWSNGPTLPDSVFYLCAVNYNSTHAFVAGGTQKSGDSTTASKTYFYDYSQDIWTSLMSFNTPRFVIRHIYVCVCVKNECDPVFFSFRFSHSCAVDDQGNILVAGTRHEYTGSTELYSPTTNTWTEVNPLPENTGGGQMVTLGVGNDGGKSRILYLSGDLESGYSNKVYEYVEGGDWAEAGSVSTEGGGKVDFVALALTEEQLCRGE